MASSLPLWITKDLQMIYSGVLSLITWRPLLCPVILMQKKAFWINAYNILAIKVVLSEYPLKSIKEVGPFYKQVWDLVAGKVAGEMYTLNHIEHKILRPLGDPLIHAAIVCASVSCPDLRTEAYVGNRVNAQLADQMRKFLTNPKKGAVFSKGKLKVSALFDFFTEDFIKSAGSLQSFLKTYVAEDMASKLSGSTKIDFMDYDWSLNDRKRARR